MITVNFVDFWPDLNKSNNYFYNILKEDHEISLSDNPDILFFSVFGGNHVRYKCKKIFFTGENIGPNFDQCDYSLTFDWLDDDRNYRLPLYILYEKAYNTILNPKMVDFSLVARSFCNCVISNGGAQKRNSFIEKLSRYRKVDSGGRWNNNIGAPVHDKLSFQRNYKFSIAFENDAYRGEHEGYTTEKIVEAMAANSMPLYWGNPVVDRDFNTSSFVNYYDFSSENEMIEYIIYLDNNNEEYLKKIANPWHVGNELPENNKRENIKKFLNKIINA